VLAPNSTRLGIEVQLLKPLTFNTMQNCDTLMFSDNEIKITKLDAVNLMRNNWDQQLLMVRAVNFSQPSWDSQKIQEIDLPP